MKKFTKVFVLLILVFLVSYYLFSVISIKLSYQNPEGLADPDSKFIDVLNIKIHYKEFGSGENTFLLVHGFGAGIFSFDPITDDLAKFGRVFSFDLPGFGLSERPPNNIAGIDPYSRAGQVEVLRAFVQKLDLKNIILLGHSMGGSVSFIYAAKYPERVKVLVLEAPAVFNEGSETLLLKFLRTRVGKFLFPMLIKPLTSALESVIYRAYYDTSKITEETKSKYKKALHVKDWDKGLYYLVSASNYVDYDELTRNFNVKTLIIIGSDDQIVPKERVLNFASKWKEVKLVEIEKCGHIPHEEKPEEFLKSLTDFLGF